MTTLEIIDPTAFERIDPAEAPRGSAATDIVTQQAAVAAFPNIVSMAVARPRDINAVLTTMKAYAAAAGENYYYRFPVRSRDGSTDYIEGPSIQLANDLAREWGNNRIDLIVIDGPTEWMIYARFADLEKGTSYVRPFRQRKSQGSLRSPNAERLLDIALQIGVSKAIRNVVCNHLQTIADFTFQAARENLVERVGRKLDEYKARAREAIAKNGVDLARVERVIGKPFDKWLAPETARVIAEIRAISEGMAAADELWPGEPPPRPERGDADPKPAAGPGSNGKERAESTKTAKPAEPTAKAAAEPPRPASGEPIGMESTASAETGEVFGRYLLYDEVGEVEVQNIGRADDFLGYLLAAAGNPAKRDAYLGNNETAINAAIAELGGNHVRVKSVEAIRGMSIRTAAKKSEPEVKVATTAPIAPGASRIGDTEFPEFGQFKSEFDRRLASVTSAAGAEQLVADNADRIGALGERFPKHKRLLLESVEARKRAVGKTT